MNDTGECTLNMRDMLTSKSVIEAAAAKGMPVTGAINPTLRPGITYITTRQMDGSMHVRWEPSEKRQETTERLARDGLL